MKKLNALFLVLLLWNFNNSFGQTVKISSILLNNQPVSDGAPINFGANSTISVSLIADVVLSSAPSDTYPGMITIYYKKNQSFSANQANGGFGGSLLFMGNAFASRSFTIELSASQFDASGGLLYAEYKTYSGTPYRSTNISVIKSIPGPVPGNPSPGGTPNNISENLPYGGIPILYQLPSDYPEIKYRWSVGYNGGDDYVFNVYNRNDEKTQLFDGVNISQETLYYSPSGVLTQSGVSKKIALYVSDFFPNLNRMYVNNKISKDQYITFGSNPATITGEVGSYYANNVPTTTLTNYKWQKRIVRPLPDYSVYVDYINIYGWKDIVGANQQNYTPETNATEVIEYRRLLIEDPLAASYNYRTAASNVVTVYPISVDSNVLNSICCDQISYTNNSLGAITGSTPHNANLYQYQWQVGTVSGGDIIWSNIPNATAKDYLPSRPSGGRFANGLVKYFRRVLVRQDNNKVYFSNSVTVTYYTSAGRMSNSNTSENTNDSILTIFPNPSSSIINVKGGNDIDSYEIKLIDTAGKTVLIRKPGNSNINLLQLNIAELASGIYELTIENESEKIVRKIIKN